MRLLNEAPEFIPDLEEFSPAPENSYNGEKHGDDDSLDTIVPSMTLDENTDEANLMCIANAAGMQSFFTSLFICLS